MPELIAFVKEHGDRLFIQAPVVPYTPEESEVETLAFAQELKRSAPNPKLLWLQGRYVEADNANANGDQWTSGDLAIKALTPVFMPVTVMHDFRTAVGVIGDTRLKLPKDDPSVPRARIETVLALWAHRFPDIAEEALVNAQQGTLMQSMECVSNAYDCSVCGMTFPRLPGGAEREQWCAHLRGETAAQDGRSAARILRNVTFTGTGLIFGTRGARGAYSEAHLEVEELAAMFEEAHRTTTSRSAPRMGQINVEQTEWERVQRERDENARKVQELTASVAEKDTAIEAAEAAKAKAEEERDKEKDKREAAEETARVAALKDDRLAKLGKGFTAKLDKLDATRKRVHQQAGEMSDEDWESRLAELEETLGVKRDDKGEGSNEGENNDGDGDKGKGEPEGTEGMLFEREEVTASSRVNGGGNNGDAATPPSSASRQSVIGGLVHPKREKAGAK